MTSYVYSPKDTINQYHTNIDFFKQAIASGEIDYQESIESPYSAFSETYFRDNFIGTRNSLLLITDWTQLESNHLSAEERVMWEEWRQLIRDITSTIDPKNDLDYLDVYFPYPEGVSNG